MCCISQKGMSNGKIGGKRQQYTFLPGTIVTLHLNRVGKGDNSKMNFPSTENSLGCPFCLTGHCCM